MWTPGYLSGTLSLLCVLTHHASSEQLACDSNAIPYPSYFGTEVTSLTANSVHDYDTTAFPDWLNIPFDRQPLDFCNITLTYTHPGLNDSMNVYIWLPLSDWNGNFLAQGGGGWAAGMDGALAPAVGLKYAAANTDAGHTFMGDMIKTGFDSKWWSLVSPGNINLVLFQDFASTALDDMTHLAKSVVESFYGRKPRYSYWNGCSTGGRQGFMQAQRYPSNYDGILAAAPAINWASFVTAEYWGQIVMQREKYFPPHCELEAITKAAIEACDELDGVKDGVIAAPGLCNFDASSVVDRDYDCNGETRKISHTAAKIANAAWEGPWRNGKREWYGATHGMPLSSPVGVGGLLNTVCDEQAKNCKGSPFPISADWIQTFLAKDPEYDLTTMTEDDFFKFLHMSRQRYSSIISTDDPDLSEFRAAGGKMISWHGLADELIIPNGTADYYERVLALDPKADDFFRYFEAPGVGHCAGGPGAYPSKVFSSLVDWVENGKTPERLDAATVPADKAEATKYRPLCPYPNVAAYIGGSPDDASSFECAASFGTKKTTFPSGHTEL